MLLIPSVDKEIPSEIVLGGHSLLVIDMLLGMCREGILVDEDVADLSRSDICPTTLTALLTKVLNRCCGDLWNYENLSILGHFIFEHNDKKPNEVIFGVDTEAVDYIKRFEFEKAFCHIEKQCPGLTGKILLHIDEVLSKFGAPFTPSGAFAMARYFYWVGEDDETVAYEEKDEDDDYDIPLRADLFKDIPEWAYDLEKAPPLKGKNSLQKSKKNDANTKKLISKLYELDELEQLSENKKMLGMSERGGCEISYQYPPVSIRWSATDGLERIFDYHYDYIMQMDSEEFALVGTCLVEEIAGQRQISEWLDSIRHTGKIFKTMDEILSILREINDEH